MSQNVAQFLPRYRRLVQGGVVFHGSCVAVTLVAAGNVTYTGFVLTNPLAIAGVTNTKRLSILRASVGFTVVFPAVSPVGLSCGFHATTEVTQGTPGIVYNALVSTNAASTAGAGLLATAATLPVTPTLREILLQGETGAVTVQSSTPSVFQIDGGIELKPGAYCAIFSTNVGPTNGMNASFTWAELTASEP